MVKLIGTFKPEYGKITELLFPILLSWIDYKKGLTNGLKFRKMFFVTPHYTPAADGDNRGQKAGQLWQQYVVAPINLFHSNHQRNP